MRRDVRQADVILPSLDAATPAAFFRINQPHAGLELERIIEGLVALRDEFPGKIWLEIFIVKGVNDREKEIAALYAALRRIQPDKVQLNTLDRPPAYSGVQSADFAVLEKIRAGGPICRSKSSSAPTAAKKYRLSAATWKTAC